MENKKKEGKNDKRSWGIAIGAAGITLIATGFVELIGLTSPNLEWIKSLAFLVLGLILFGLAVKIVPELMKW